MQGSDTLDRIRREIDERLGELRPQVQEYASIEAAARVLDDSRSRTAVGNGRARRGRARKSALPDARRSPSGAPSSALKPPMGARRPKGANQVAIVKVLRERATPERPLTARQVADATGLAPTTVHGALRPLTERRVVRLIKQPKGRKSYVLATRGRSSSS
ncbi:MAG: hypothetical protein E6G34_02320 [Actinobacteria bacterium]|nr:MAG: hypothetical protein E6G34_02320 [Actinomycetota bacterium]